MRATPDAMFNFKTPPPRLDDLDRWRLRDGTDLALRPMRAQDSLMLDGMVERLSPHARHNRFHGGVNSRPGLLACPGGGAGQVAFVVTAERQRSLQVVAEARYAVDSQGESAEFAIVVADDWQRRGLGERAMRALADAAVRSGLHWLHGEVFADNRPMLALMRRCHFFCTPDADDPRLVHVESPLHVDAAAVNRRA